MILKNRSSSNFPLDVPPVPQPMEGTNDSMQPMTTCRAPLLVDKYRTEKREITRSSSIETRTLFQLSAAALYRSTARQQHIRGQRVCSLSLTYAYFRWHHASSPRSRRPGPGALQRRRFRSAASSSFAVSSSFQTALPTAVLVVFFLGDCCVCCCRLSLPWREARAFAYPLRCQVRRWSAGGWLLCGASPCPSVDCAWGDGRGAHSGGARWTRHAPTWWGYWYVWDTSLRRLVAG